VLHFHLLITATLSSTNYDALLIGWDAQNLQNGVSFNGGNSQFCSTAAQTARANMIASDGWSITDGGLDAGCTTLSVPEEDFADFSLYPNPASNYVNIKGSIIDLKQIDIFNINGQLVKTVTSNLDQIDISNLESAVYFIRLYSDTSSKTMKLIKK